MNWPMEIPETDADKKKMYLINVKGCHYRAVGKGWSFESIKFIRTIVYSCDGRFYVSTWLGYRSQLFNQKRIKVLL